MAVKYSTESGIVVTALRYTSTIVPMVVDGFEFWFLLFLTTMVSVLRHIGVFTPEKYHLDIPYDLTGITGKLMTFFVCFYNGHVFKRYNKLYALTKHMTDTCLEVVSSTRVEKFDQAVQRKITKLTVASTFLFFFQRSCHHDAREAVSTQEYRQLVELELLTPVEVRALRQHCEEFGKESLPSTVVLEWAMQYAHRVTDQPHTRDDMLQALFGRLYKIRKCQFHVAAIMELPMPFQYFHIMNLMLALNLLVQAVSLGGKDTVFGPVIFTFVQMMFQGVRELSTALSNPFGDDEVDFPINEWMTQLYSTLYGVLEDRYDISNLEVRGDKPILPPSIARRKLNLLVDINVNQDDDVVKPVPQAKLGVNMKERFCSKRRKEAPSGHGPTKGALDGTAPFAPLLPPRARAARQAEVEAELTKRRSKWGLFTG